MSRKVTLIEDIPVEKPHDAVQEFIENVLQKQLDTPSTSIRCALPKSDEEVKLARENSVPSSTRNDCCKVWSEWAYNRNKFCIATNSLAPEDPATVDIDNLAYWLERFVLEIRTKQGNEYNPNSLHHLVCGILRRDRNDKPGIDFFKDSQFAYFRMTLDAEMKRIRMSGKGSNKRQAEPLTFEDEEKLWTQGLLGDHSPLALLNTCVEYILHLEVEGNIEA